MDHGGAAAAPATGGHGLGVSAGDLDYPQKTFRENFRDVLLHEHLRQAILQDQRSRKSG